MGLFNRNFDRPGPGVEKNAPRKKGIARWGEMVGRDAWDFTKANVLTALCILPSAIGGVLLFIGGGGILLTLLAATLLGFLVGPSLCGLSAILLKSLRDEPGYFWQTYKKAFKSNFKISILPGMIFTLLMGVEAMAALIYLSGASQSALVLAMLILNLLVATMVMSYYIPQLVLLDLPGIKIFTNSLRFSFGYLKRSLPAALVQIVLIGGQALLLPLSFPVLLLIGLWLPLSIGTFLIYKPMDDVFKIEEQFQARRERERLAQENEAPQT